MRDSAENGAVSLEVLKTGWEMHFSRPGPDAVTKMAGHLILCTQRIFIMALWQFYRPLLSHIIIVLLLSGHQPIQRAVIGLVLKFSLLFQYAIYNSGYLQSVSQKDTKCYECLYIISLWNPSFSMKILYEWNTINRKKLSSNINDVVLCFI